MLMRFDPFREFDRLTQTVGSGLGCGWMPMDAYRSGDHFVVHLDVPGVDPASIEVTVEKDVLTVKAERSWRLAEGDELIVSERPQGSFTRRLFLGEGVDGNRIEARYENGVLTLVVPVAESAKPRKVEITAGNAKSALEAQAQSIES
jgi:HSP20 family protein